MRDAALDDRRAMRDRAASCSCLRTSFYAIVAQIEATL
jgi:hypothetical protein